jgi:hypothetical protein
VEEFERAKRKGFVSLNGGNQGYRYQSQKGKQTIGAVQGSPEAMQRRNEKAVGIAVSTWARMRLSKRR